MFFSVRTRASVIIAAAALALTACGSGAGSGDAEGEPTIATAFYPLEYATARIVGEHATVINLTRPGAEPHDVELGLRDVAAVQDADLVVYLKGFQPAVDDAVAERGDAPSLDVGQSVDLGDDPHFWLDPRLYREVVDEITARLAAVDTAHAERFEANAARLKADLAALDADFEAGLATCESRHLVTSHEAFGHLARRYDLEQLGITGLSPEQEPSPAKLAELSDFVRRHDVTTIYYETLVSPAIAEAVAEETGANVAVLDPLEGLSEGSGDGQDSANGSSDQNDYLRIMRANLATLQKGQRCT
ncbi:MAG TPA: metal ABC transporter substrate-binding protein [Actinopolymorphaceae bacterium]